MSQKRKKRKQLKNNGKENLTVSMEKMNSNALITKDFFSNEISIDENNVFPVIVMATMSSGKSTLINALLGQQVLPSKNEACT
ncbi:MAG: dynamin family protein, partial [Tyzzerella sp.]|nr:dynamin family protein [Tyzzerella sp.]